MIFTFFLILIPAQFALYSTISCLSRYFAYKLYTMADSADIQLNKLITYTSDLTSPTTPLTIVNKSDHYYIFKIRTNHKNAISLAPINGFLRPASVLEIPIKLIQKPSATIPLKLEINQAIATQEEYAKNDPKGTIATRKDLIKEIIMIVPELGSSRNKEKADKSVRNESSGTLHCSQGKYFLPPNSANRIGQEGTIESNLSLSD